MRVAAAPVLAVTLAFGAALGAPARAAADSCVTLEGANVDNKCETCMKVTLRELNRGGQAQGLYASEPRSVQVQPGARVSVPGAERSAITDIGKCE